MSKGFVEAAATVSQTPLVYLKASAEDGRQLAQGTWGCCQKPLPAGGLVLSIICQLEIGDHV